MGDVTNALASIMPKFMKELAASLTPWIEVITSGGAAVLKEMMERKGQTGMVGFGSDGL